MNTTSSGRAVIGFFLFIIAAGLLLWMSPAVQGGASAPTSTTTPGPPVLTGATDDQPPVVPGGASSWEQLFQKVGNNDGYWRCFETRTGHNRAEAVTALARERQGWNVQVALVSNTDVPTADQALDSKGLPRDPDVVVVHGFSNTRGAGAGGCEGFSDSRAQVRDALTLSGVNAGTPGLPVVLGFCANPIGQAQTPPPPAKPMPKTPQAKQPKAPKVTAPKVPTPKTPKLPHSTTTVKCPNAGLCGTPDSGPEFIPPQDNNPKLVAPTPGYKPGGAEANAAAQTPKPGADPYRPTSNGTAGTGAGGTTPSGQTQTPSGAATGGSAGASNPQQTNVGNQSNTAPVTGEP